MRARRLFGALGLSTSLGKIEHEHEHDDERETPSITSPDRAEGSKTRGPWR
jgi:hypothetical protein